MADKNTSPGVFSNENLSSEFLGRDVDAFKKIEIRNRVNQSLPTLTLPRNVNQGFVDIRFPEPPAEKESVILRRLALTQQKKGVQVQLSRRVEDKISPVNIAPIESIVHTSPILVQLFGVFRHTSTIVISKFGVFTHTSNITPTAFGVFEHDSATITTPLEIQQHFSFTRDRVPYSLDFSSKLAIPVTKSLFRRTISLADRLSQTNLGTTTHLPQYFLSDLFADYIKVIPFGTFEHVSPLGLLVFDFLPSQGGLLPNIFNFDSQTAQGIYLNNIGSLVSSVFLPTTSFNTDTIPEQGSTTVDESVFADGLQQREQNRINSSPDVELPIQQVTLAQGVFVQNGQFQSIIQVQTPVLDIILRQGVYENNSGLFSFTNPQTPIAPEDLPKNGVVPNLSPSPTSNAQAQEDSAQEPQVLTYSLDRLLAVTLPRVKHGSATLTNIEYQADKAQAENEPVKKHGDADASQLGPLKEQNFEPDQVLTTKVNPITGTPQITPGGGPEGSSFVQLPEPTQGAPNSSQPQTLANSSTFTHTGGELTKYKSLSYGEIFQKASSGQQTPTAPAVFSPAVEVEGDNDFINITINGIRFRSFITSFNESYSPSWSDIRYVGVQDVLKQFTGVTRAASLGFKTAAFSRTDLQNLYLKLNRLAAETCIGSYSGVYLTPPITRLTIGNWFINTPCTTNSLKFDINVAEEPWDIGQAGVDGDTNPQMPKIVSVTMDFTILGTNTGAPLNRNDGPYISYASIVASGLGAG
jgi:hypothetical protein